MAREVPDLELLQSHLMAAERTLGPDGDVVQFLEATRDIRDFTATAIQTTVVNAVETGVLTRSGAARCAGVHPNTAAKWLLNHEQ